MPSPFPVALEESRETYIEIRVPRNDDERVITSIEILSVPNKTPGEKRRERYVAKQTEIMGATNLVEIDLLRGGTHTTAVPLSRLKRETSAFDYHVSVFTSDTGYWVYPILLEEALPEIAVPLLPEAGAARLDLQNVLNRCYDAGPYKRRVKYDVKRLVPPLSAKKVRWVKQRLREIKNSHG